MLLILECKNLIIDVMWFNVGCNFFLICFERIGWWFIRMSKIVLDKE